ncbi:Cytochrome P450 82C4 like [Actinidia chinensis var. chinensis]|uniref:Cytochrome P450 82C4 like n=1 Tax=Actinidia chinensis var. chinensis TaxID=1590841 RepID=A0A2R6PPF0_ACTCC|nr:Cytochrome P450 82C4 like [Actinidia chinensis var. chinensis]
MSMDFLTHLLPPLVLLALIVHFSIHKLRPSNKLTKTLTKAPEPPGSLPFIGHLHLLGGPAPVFRTLGTMANEHGPIFSIRLGSHQALVVSSWEYVKECFTTNDRIFASRPMMALGKYMGYDHAVFALAPYGPYWRDVRKMVTLELLTNHQLEKLRHVRESEVDLCVRDLHSLCAKNKEMSALVAMNEWLEHLTFNIIVKMLVGKRVFDSTTRSNTNSQEFGFKEAIKKALYLSGVFVASDAIPSLEWVDVGGYVKAMKQTGKEIDQVLGRWLEEHVRRREKEGGRGDKGDFIDVMLSVLSEDTVMAGYKRDTIIKSTTLILILTGSESTAETLTWALSLLLNNPHALKTAQEELDLHVGRNKWVQESDIANLNYLQAIVKETLRLYPPAPLSGPREAIEDCRVGGYDIKKGTRLIVNLWKLQRDSRIWDDPNEFKPERFLSDHANVGFRGQQFEYIPFSSGRRMCPAVTFGLQVVQLTLARLLQGFDMTTPMGMPVDMTEGLGIALPKVCPLEVVLTPRLPLKAYQDL